MKKILDIAFIAAFIAVSMFGSFLFGLTMNPKPVEFSYKIPHSTTISLLEEKERCDEWGGHFYMFENVRGEAATPQKFTLRCSHQTKDTQYDLLNDLLTYVTYVELLFEYEIEL